MSFALASPQLLNFTERGSGPPLLLVAQADGHRRDVEP
jgi:hypothetical protein